MGAKSRACARALAGRSPWLAPLAAVLATCASGLAQETERVHVLYPRGECETGVIEIEVWSRSNRRWVPHPEHPRIPGDTCQSEDPGILLNELRVRCVDPGDARRRSTWLVGVDIRRPAPDSRCGPPAREAAAPPGED